MGNKGTWEHEQIFQGNLGAKWILGRNLEFLLGGQSKTFLEIRDILGIFLGNTRAQTPWGASFGRMPGMMAA